MADLFWLTNQIERMTPYFPPSHGVPRVDDQRVVSVIIHVICNGLRWRDAPAEYSPHKTLYNRLVRGSRMGVFNRIFVGLAGRKGQPDRLMIDATHLKAHRTAASLLKKGLLRAVSDAPRVAGIPNCTWPQTGKAAHSRPDERSQARGADAECSAAEAAGSRACWPAEVQARADRLMPGSLSSPPPELCRSGDRRPGRR
ncbi:transposase [Roseomonas ludipueritiae]|uniref:Transposase n=1 Tax=Pseudoroseomonas ludipueritiae TaxID=198093 RepID=A0ABR7R3C2_9PROT|nr:transposase [Pseudoroseomonas ludipueritiae]